MEEELYQEIQLWEFFGQGWMKADKERKSKNILAFIHRFNHVSAWVTSEVLKHNDPKQRALTMIHFLKIAKACFELNNFNGCMEVLAGLSTGAVARLKQTWNLLKDKDTKLFAELNSLMDNNFKNLREGVTSARPPCIPYLGVYLSDLIFLDEGNPDYLPNGLINFAKFRQIALVLQAIQQFQYSPYVLQPVAPIADFIEKVLWECISPSGYE